MIRIAECRCRACAVEVEGEPAATNSDDQRCAWVTLPDGWRVRTTAMAEASRSSSPG